MVIRIPIPIRLTGVRSSTTLGASGGRGDRADFVQEAGQLDVSLMLHVPKEYILWR